MKKITLFASTLVALALPVFASDDFEIKKVEVQFVPTPEYQSSVPAKPVRPQKWMAVDVTFSAKPAYTDELTVNYYILFAGRLFTGHVNHVSIEKGRELHSVAYMSPQAISQILEGKQPAPADLENVSVTLVKPGIADPISSKSWKPSNGAWWTTLKQEDGFVLNKNETPFALLSWSYYEAIKPASAH